MAIQGKKSRAGKNRKNSQHTSIESNLKTRASELLECAKVASACKVNLRQNDNREERLIRDSNPCKLVEELLFALDLLSLRTRGFVDQLRDCQSTSWLADAVETVNGKIIENTRTLSSAFNRTNDDAGNGLPPGHGISYGQMASTLAGVSSSLEYLANKLEQICVHRRCNRTVCKVPES